MSGLIFSLLITNLYPSEEVDPISILRGAVFKVEILVKDLNAEYFKGCLRLSIEIISTNAETTIKH